MKRVVIFVGLGLLTPLLYVLGAEAFEVSGRDSFLEVAAGSVVVALYCAACHFVIARRRGGGFGANWPTMVAMLGAMLAVSLVILAVEGGRTWLVQAVPMLAAGCLGTLMGMAVGTRRSSIVTRSPRL